MAVAIYVAIANDNVIGREGGLPWRLSSDLQRFKTTTMGKPIVMGRKTWESFPKRPLPGRRNIVVSRDAAYQAPGAEVATSLEAALSLARTADGAPIDSGEICILGGGQIYGQALPLADRLYVTHVLADIPDGDTRFPAIDPSEWEAVSSEEFPAGPKDNFPTRYVVYERRAGVQPREKP
ncbi:MAG TPA: dihydrofolate reductase [Mesorhizobium sp.]